MKGVVIAGGQGTRLRPLTRVINKDLLAVYDKPLLYYPILTLRDAGIKEILVISGRGHAGQFLDLLGSGKELGVNLAYDVQEEPGGIAQALSIAEDFCDQGPVLAILGDNVFEDNFKKAVKDFRKQKRGAKVVIHQVPDPERFGVVSFNKKETKIVKIAEKPKRADSNWAVTGLYMYDENVWNIIRNLKPSKRGELEITDVNQAYVKKSEMTFEKTKGFWLDAGTFDSLLKANILVAEQMKKDTKFFKI